LVERQIRNIKFFIETGDVKCVTLLLRHESLGSAYARGSESVQSAIADARLWLAAAEEYEALHGPGSKIVDDHPFNIQCREWEILPPPRLRVAA
jgi:hypothetical protein